MSRASAPAFPMGPLRGLRVLEFEAIGPGPFAAMMLADMGADVLRVDGPAHATRHKRNRAVDVMLRGRRSVTIDLKSPRRREAVLRLVDRADASSKASGPASRSGSASAPTDRRRAIRASYTAA